MLYCTYFYDVTCPYVTPFSKLVRPRVELYGSTHINATKTLLIYSYYNPYHRVYIYSFRRYVLCILYKLRSAYSYYNNNNNICYRLPACFVTSYGHDITMDTNKVGGQIEESVFTLKKKSLLQYVQGRTFRERRF